MISKPLTKYVLVAAMRDKLMITLIMMIAVTTALATFLGASSLSEKDSFALVFGAAGLRFLNVVGMTVFICFYIRRSFETKEIEFLLSRPLTRTRFLLSHALAFSMMALLTAGLMVVSISFLGNVHPEGWMLWGFSIAIESILVTLIALFFAMVLSSAAGAVMATLGFYTLSRLIGILLAIASHPSEKTYMIIMNNVLEVISVIVPRLDLMGQTSWLIYGLEGSGGIGVLSGVARDGLAYQYLEILTVPGFIGVQGALFLILVLSATLFDFMRRQF